MARTRMTTFLDCTSADDQSIQRCALGTIAILARPYIARLSARQVRFGCRKSNADVRDFFASYRFVMLGVETM
jgi:hypothetical protein